MKKEYKAPTLRHLDLDKEMPILCHSYDWGDAKKNGRIYEDEEDIAPAATSKGFWDDEN